MKKRTKMIVIILIVSIISIAAALAWHEHATAPTTSVTSTITEYVIIESPKEGERITSPLTISGKARGTWFFEASFPVILTDGDGSIIAESYATADGEWMTEDFVPFTATIEFEKPSGGDRGTLILKKDNPSGLPQYDDAVEIGVRW